MFEYSVKAIKKVLDLRKSDTAIAEIVDFFDLKRAAIIEEDELLCFVGEKLSEHLEIDTFMNFEEYNGIQGVYDFILMQDKFSENAMKLKFKGEIVHDCEGFLDSIEYQLTIWKKMQLLSNVTDEVFLFTYPTVFEIKNPSGSELNFMHSRNAKHVASLSLQLEENEREEYENITTMRMNLTKKNGEFFLADYRSKFRNNVNGRRITTDNPESFDNKLFVIGDSLAYGVGTEDRLTIPSHIQRDLNVSGIPQKVINCGGYGLINTYNVIEEVRKGDRIIYIIGSISRSMLIRRLTYIAPFIRFCSLNYLFDRPHDMGEVYVDYSHVNHIGTAIVAQEICKIITREPNIGVVKFDGTELLNQQKASELKDKWLSDFLDKASSIKNDSTNNGAIVVNCNPFTNGHKYLIEYASNHVEHLYVFVVEEDRSLFCFNDRLSLVKNEVERLSNVTVLPSGKLIISSLTFEEYFSKDDLQDVSVNVALDIEIFAKYIAPGLNISKRYVGQEPHDNVTRQYNKAMQEVLPKYGIECIEIPRKEQNGYPISASSVRELIKVGDLNGIKEIVPLFTYNFIANHILQLPDANMNEKRHSPEEHEFWDILDEDRNMVERTHKRGEKMQTGNYHLVVRAWIMNSKGEFLITRRALNKERFPGMWEVPSGAAKAGEESIEAVLREVREECGITLRSEAAELFSTYRHNELGTFNDCWLFRHEFNLSDAVLQENETVGIKVATWGEISVMMEQSKFIGRDIFFEFDLLMNWVDSCASNPTNL